ncbi:MAG: DUF4147 domain-containing protein [Nanoarchaeota archaeon]|nr:DUF4147 domain-containing protein [Nanoarchaeota archaeon]
MKIQNFDTLAVSDLRKVGLLIAEAGLQAIDTERVIRDAIRLEGGVLFIQNKKYPLEHVGRIFVMGVGKCASEAASALEEVLGERISGGVIIDVKEGKHLKYITAYKGSHPLPTDANVNASRNMIYLLQGLHADDLVLFCISGGASTLLCLPEEGGRCETEAELFRLLTASGVTIRELNTVRKHLSLARGGYLAKEAYPARVVSLIFSDVPGNDIQFIASGPTVKDTTTVKDAEAILKKYDVLKNPGVWKIKLLETPKDRKYFERVTNTIVVSNDVALRSMAEKALELGYAPEVRTSALHGEAREAGEKILKESRKAPAGSVLLYGGETTVTARGKGRGGRNLELALSGLRFVSEGELLISLASDGRDNTDFAGGVCDIIAREKARAAGLDAEEHLHENNAYSFFEKTEDYILTGDTGSNVSDLVLVIKQNNK